MIKFTHYGYEVGMDARIHDNYHRKVMLRETKTMWISQCGRRYSKKRDGVVHGDWPMWKLNLDTVKPL